MFDRTMLLAGEPRLAWCVLAARWHVMVMWTWPDGVATALPPASVGLTSAEAVDLGTHPECPRDQARNLFTDRVMRERAVWLAEVEPMGYC